MPRYQWSTLSKQQISAYAEYFVKMELTIHGFEVYTTEVDDHDIDFVARRQGSPFIEVQVKPLRKYGYVYMQKMKFEIRDNVYLALGLFFENEAPRLYLIPATTWHHPNNVIVDKNYNAPNLKSKPEWGLHLSEKNMSTIEAYNFETTVKQMAQRADGVMRL